MLSWQIQTFREKLYNLWLNAQAATILQKTKMTLFAMTLFNEGITHYWQPSSFHYADHPKNYTLIKNPNITRGTRASWLSSLSTSVAEESAWSER